MKINKTKIRGVYIIEPEPRDDPRGYFVRVFANEELEKNNISFNIVHVNRSMTVKKGTIRGIHYQIKPRQEDKIVTVLRGAIFDVALDVRRNSDTFGQWVDIELSDENRKMLLVPKGCAHGFQTLKPNTVVEYFVSEYYSPKDERGIRWNDPFFKIKWPIARAKVSEKDASWPLYKK